ncbi:MAG: Lacal_2735 family protein [Aequorivita sp.]
MFNIFKKKSEVELLDAKYKKLLKEAYGLSTSNRKESDKKYGEADTVLKRIEALKNQ